MSNKMFLAILLLSASAVFTLVESSHCPDFETIEPCYCIEDDSEARAVCSYIESPDDLRKFAQNSDGYSYEEVVIQNSRLPSIPKQILQDIKMKKFVMRNLNLTRLFVGIPKTLPTLQSISVENVQARTGLSWIYFQHATGLKSLFIRDTPVPVIGTDFNQFVPKSVKYVECRKTGTSEIQKGAFRDFKSLESIAVIYNELKRLHRNCFPLTYNGTSLRFQNNKLEKVSPELFTDMPKLIYVDLSRNKIKSIPEPSAEEGISQNLHTVNLLDNPIVCDCHLKWIPTLDSKDVLLGSCAAPKALKEKSLQFLTAEDFKHC